MKNRFLQSALSLNLLSFVWLGALAGFSASTDAAQFYVESNGFYFSDGLKINSTTTNSRMLIDGSLGFTLDKKNRWQAGWNYTMHSATATGGQTESYSSSEMGPKFGYYFDKRRQWGASFTYNLIVTGSYKAGAGSTQNLRGTSFRLDFGYGAEVTEKLRLGLRLVYNLATYGEEVDDTTLTKVSYSRTFIYPAFHIGYLF